MWGEKDSNLRSLRRQIYSLFHLATLVSPRERVMRFTGILRASQLFLFFKERFEPMEGLEPPTY